MGDRRKVAAAEVLYIEPSALRVNSLLLPLEVLQLAPRSGQIFWAEAALNLLAPDFLPRRMAIKTFPDLLEGWT
jgi:hypothetical protein